MFELYYCYYVLENFEHFIVEAFLALQLKNIQWIKKTYIDLRIMI